jgi:hypothetical protein
MRIGHRVPIGMCTGMGCWWKTDAAPLGCPGGCGPTSFFAVGSKSARGPGFCRFDRQIVQRLCMPKERFPPGVFSAEILSQVRVI